MPYPYEIYLKGGVGTDEPRSIEEQHAIVEKYQYGGFWTDQTFVYKNQHANLTEYVDKKIPSYLHRQVTAEKNKRIKIPAIEAMDAGRAGAGVVFGDLTETCPALSIGAAASEELAFELGACIARELRCAGVSWRWAPVVDVAHRHSSAIMRSFVPDDIDLMIKLSVAHIKGMQSEGLAACAKHFPGGDRYEYRDSHFCTTTNDTPMNEWWEEQGKIFQAVIDSGVYSVMIGHSGFPAVDDSMLKGEYRPCTVSKKVITDLLKEKMGFKGVVITDAVDMAALFGRYDTRDEMVIDLINAGNDMLLGAPMNSVDVIEKAVNDGLILESRIDDACQRMLDMKEKMGMFRDDYWDLPYTVEEAVAKTKAVNTEIAERSMTLVRDRRAMLPFNKDKVKNVTIVCSTHADYFFEQLEFMKECFEKRGAKVRLQRRIKSIAEMKEIDESSDLIIYAVYVAQHQPFGHMGLYGAECTTYIRAFTEGKEKSVGVSMGYPYIHYDILGNADAFINAYGTSPDIMEAFVKAVYGEIEITGKSPVELNPRLRR